MKKEKFFVWLEKHGPLAISILTACLFGKFLVKPVLQLGNEIDNIINAVITFASIIVGFLGVFIGILFGMGTSESISLLLEKESGRVKRYFIEPLISGMLVILFGTLLYVREKISFADIITALWTGLIIYLIASSFRIINSMMYILFQHRKVDKTLENKDAKTSPEVEKLIEKHKSNEGIRG